VLQCVAWCCSVLQCVAACHSVLQCVAVRVAVCCSVLKQTWSCRACDQMRVHMYLSCACPLFGRVHARVYECVSL